MEIFITGTFQDIDTSKAAAALKHSFAEKGFNDVTTILISDVEVVKSKYPSAIIIELVNVNGVKYCYLSNYTIVSKAVNFAFADIFVDSIIKDIQKNDGKSINNTIAQIKQDILNNVTLELVRSCEDSVYMSSKLLDGDLSVVYKYNGNYLSKDFCDKYGISEDDIYSYASCNTLDMGADISELANGLYRLKLKKTAVTDYSGAAIASNYLFIQFSSVTGVKAFFIRVFSDELILIPNPKDLKTARSYALIKQNQTPHTFITDNVYYYQNDVKTTVCCR